MYDSDSVPEGTAPAEGPLGKDCSYHERIWEFCLHIAFDLQICIMFRLLSKKLTVVAEKNFLLYASRECHNSDSRNHII